MSGPYWSTSLRTHSGKPCAIACFITSIAFALLMSGAAILVGQISIGIERLVVINLGLTAVSLFGVVIAIFIGIGLVSKEIDKRTLYTVLSRPVRRWEFIVGKFFGLAGTLVVNASSWRSEYLRRCITFLTASRLRRLGAGRVVFHHPCNS